MVEEIELLKVLYALWVTDFWKCSDSDNYKCIKIHTLNKRHNTGCKKIKLTLSSGDIIVYIENARINKETPQNSRFKINTKNQLHFYLLNMMYKKTELKISHYFSQYLQIN